MAFKSLDLAGCQRESQKLLLQAGARRGSGNAPSQIERRRLVPRTATYLLNGFLDPFRSCNKNNEYLNNPDIPEADRIILRKVQATYEVLLIPFSSQGYDHRIELVWHCDRLWGTFDFGYCKGVMLIEPGPTVEDLYGFKTLPFIWIKPCRHGLPNALDWNTGEIRLDGNMIGGHFNNTPGLGRCEFIGQRLHGPPLSTRSSHSFIDEWDDLDISSDEDDEAVRLPPRSKSSELASSEPEPPEWLASLEPQSSLDRTAKDKREFLAMVTGIFNITSRAIEHNWSTKAKKLSIRFHVDREKIAVWGKFSLGICNGFLLMKNSPDSLKQGVPLKFRWRGRETDTGDSISGTGEVSIKKDRTIQGVFHDMYGNVDFSGKRKFMPNNESGYEASYYRSQWKEYERVERQLG